jgi:hypothetical protein
MQAFPACQRAARPLLTRFRNPRLIPEKRWRDSGDVAWDAAHQRGQSQPKSFLVRVLYIQALMTVKSATSSMMTMKTDSRTAKGLAICEAARTLTETSLKLNRVEQVI